MGIIRIHKEIYAENNSNLFVYFTNIAIKMLCYISGGNVYGNLGFMLKAKIKLSCYPLSPHHLILKLILEWSKKEQGFAQGLLLVPSLLMFNREIISQFGPQDS